MTEETLKERVDRHVRVVVINALLDPRNGEQGFVTQAEALFGSQAFDNCFSRVDGEELERMLKEYANDEEEGHGPIKDFLGTVEEYRAMPCDSLNRRMIDSAKRMRG